MMLFPSMIISKVKTIAIIAVLVCLLLGLTNPPPRIQYTLVVKDNQFVNTNDVFLIESI
jgi:hypothetical protein